MREPETELEPVPDYADLYSRPFKMMPDETVLISCQACDDEDHGGMRDERGDAFLAAETDASELALPISFAPEDDACSLDSDASETTFTHAFYCACAKPCQTKVSWTP